MNVVQHYISKLNRIEMEQFFEEHALALTVINDLFELSKAKPRNECVSGECSAFSATSA